MCGKKIETTYVGNQMLSKPGDLLIKHGRTGSIGIVLQQLQGYYCKVLWCKSGSIRLELDVVANDFMSTQWRAPGV
jgi:hypothetical protein